MADRAVLLAVACAAIVLAALALRAFEARSDAFVLASDPGPGDVERVQELLVTARRWAPDGPAAMIEATLLERAGREAEAAAVLERLVRSEPENAQAWDALAGVATPRRAEEARARLRALVPPVAPVAPGE